VATKIIFIALRPSLPGRPAGSITVKTPETLSGSFNSHYNTVYDDQNGEKAFGMSHKQYQTVRDVADLLKVSEVTVRRWIKDGDLRAIDIGKGWRIGPGDLDSFLEGHATRPATAVNGATESPRADDKAGGKKEQKN
jgi:excisionase family DNA binding protein